MIDSEDIRARMHDHTVVNDTAVVVLTAAEVHELLEAYDTGLMLSKKQLQTLIRVLERSWLFTSERDLLLALKDFAQDRNLGS